MTTLPLEIEPDDADNPDPGIPDNVTIMEEDDDDADQ